VTLAMLTAIIFNTLFGALYYESVSLSPLRLFPPYLQIYRFLLFPMLPWLPTPATSSLFYVLLLNLHGLFCGALPLLLMTLYWERLWGSRALVLYLGVVSGAVAAVTTLQVIIAAMASLTFQYKMAVAQFSGPWAWLAAYLVAYKQWNPEHLFLSLIRIKWTPLLYLSKSCCCEIC
jgi:hypothetical protein